MPATFSFFTNTNPNNPQSPSSYAIITGTPTCSGNQVVCAIYAQVDDNDKPIITTALSTEISTALNNHVSSANVKLRT